MGKDLSDRIADWLQGILVALSILIGLTIFGWQVYSWLRTGYWTQMPLSKAIDYIGIDLTTVYYPRDWRGVAHVARWFLAWPMTICIPIIIGTLAQIIVIIIQWDTLPPGKSLQ